MGYDLKFSLLPQCDNPHQRETEFLQAKELPFLVIGPKSPLSWRKAVDEIGCYFKRELRFEQFPYSIREDFETHMDRVLVFHSPKIVDRDPTPRNPKDHTTYHVFWGAVCIRRRIGEKSANWAIAWAWLHPYERRRGHLTNAWPLILKMFPNPELEPPVSPAMEAFHKKVNHTFNEQASQRLIFDLAHLRIREHFRRCDEIKRGIIDGETPRLDTTLRIHPEDFSIAHKQVCQRTAMLPSRNGNDIRFDYWVDWTLIPDSDVQPFLSRNLDLKATGNIKD